MKSCQKISNTFSEYLDGYLSNSEIIQIDQHLSMCTKCRNEFKSIKLLKSSLASLSKHQTLPYFQPVLHAKIRERERDVKSWMENKFLNIRIPVYIGSTAVVVLLVLFLLKPALYNSKPITNITSSDDQSTNQTQSFSRKSDQRSQLAQSSAHVNQAFETNNSSILVRKDQNNIIYF